MSINKTKIHKIKKWIVKYDDVYQMPQFIQGLSIGNEKQVLIDNIESIDLMDNIVTTYSGIKYNLIGSGKRMVLIPEDKYFEIFYMDSANKK